jgi:hypothetical protein
MGGDRNDTLLELMSKDLVQLRLRDGSPPSDYVEWLKNCRVIWNHPLTGGMKSQHIKARVIEAALAGCLVLEKEGSPLQNWFEPGRDYLTWSDVDDVARKLWWVRGNELEASEIPKRMVGKLFTKYGVENFWRSVEERIGVLKCVA